MSIFRSAFDNLNNAYNIFYGTSKHLTTVQFWGTVILHWHFYKKHVHCGRDTQYDRTGTLLTPVRVKSLTKIAWGVRKEEARPLHGQFPSLSRPIWCLHTRDFSSSRSDRQTHGHARRLWSKNMKNWNSCIYYRKSSNLTAMDIHTDEYA